MKNILVIITILAIAVSCNPPVKNSYTINGTVDSTFEGWVYLQKRVEGPMTSIDSVMLENGKFFLKGTADYPEIHYINIKETKSLIPFFLEPAKISIAINTKDINKTIISGSASQEQYDQYLNILDQYNFKLRENYGMYAKAEEIGDAEKAALYDSLIIDIDNQRSAFIKEYIRTNTQSPITPYLLYRNLYNYDLKELNEVMSTLDTNLNASPYMPLLSDYLKTLKRTEIGMLYVSFMMQDTTGIYLPIVDLIGENYLLVDFWASWCGPCRDENPNLVAVYNDYKDKGFDILGVSLDRDKDSWLKAIRNDNLTWHHVSDLLYWENRAAKIYGVRSIPSNVLIDPNGIIIAKNLRGKELREKLEEIFDKPKV
jgi:thiol-disulfide isomerase/thioredoxin